MRETRSGSQILFGYLPEQTVDLAGRIWRVTKWRSPRPRSIDDATLRQALIREAESWRAAGTDAGFVGELRGGREISVVSLSLDDGVEVALFPQVWVCKSCSELGRSSTTTCACGSNRWAQLPFIGYHDCGALREPLLRRCPTHNRARVTFPATQSAKEIRFKCPVCSWADNGLGFAQCECGQGRVSWAVPRATSAYMPRRVVLVNPPNPTIVQAMRAGGGETRALEWVLAGMRTRRPNEGELTRSSLVEDLMRKGLPRSVAEQMADVAAGSGKVGAESNGHSVSDAVRASAGPQAVDLALATDQSRLTISDLVAAAGDTSRADLYKRNYAEALERAGLEAVDLLDKFPVMTAMFGYTRGDTGAGKTTLRPFRTSGSPAYQVYADMADTEALLLRLSPRRVARWLALRGHAMPVAAYEDDQAARRTIVELAAWDGGIHTGDAPAITRDLYTLVHSYAHRFIRRASTFSGIERSALNEYLVPWHLSFFVYGSARGDFVLGGLQAVFESDLHHLLRDVVDGEHRCALDPGCGRAGGACLACLHLGEPSCRDFNTVLDRRTLFGIAGYLSPTTAKVGPAPVTTT